IYIAAGMICSEATHIKYQVPPSHIIIKDILEQADKYHISLDLNWFPSLKDTFNINAPLGATAVMYAAKQGHLESMKILLKRGADYTRSDGEYENIFHYALKGRNRKILDELLLLPNIDELLFEKNTKNIAPVDIIQGRDPDLYKSIINDMLEKEEKNNSNDKKDNPNNLKPLNEFFTYMHQELTNTIQDTKSNTLFETKQLKIFLKQFDELLTASQKNLQLQVDVSQIKTLLDARKGFLEIAHRGKNPTGIYATTYSSALLLIKKLLEEITPYVELIKHQKTP
ncbi:MAG: ankyrin repeat domain-containing protein, partial [Gammaproteobacteria bacterium]|nr:ankyrin repeat domain-containing protein [Gammaproteobacteria bacterium]